MRNCIKDLTATLIICQQKNQTNCFELSSSGGKRIQTSNWRKLLHMEYQKKKILKK